jgi:hypothetical protein
MSDELSLKRNGRQNRDSVLQPICVSISVVPSATGPPLNSMTMLWNGAVAQGGEAGFVTGLRLASESGWVPNNSGVVGGWRLLT